MGANFCLVSRSLEKKLGQAAMGNAFLLQGGDCAESFKEFNANNIRDTFRVLLQMSVVLMFGGQMPVIKVSFLSFCFHQIPGREISQVLESLFCLFSLVLGLSATLSIFSVSGPSVSNFERKFIVSLSKMIFEWILPVVSLCF